MNARFVLYAFPLFAFGCSFTPRDDGLHPEFHPPVVAESWHARNYALRNGTPVCAVSSGYNGLTVTLSHPAGGEEVVVESNRMMQPGATLTVYAGGENFETYDTFFPAKSGPSLARDLAKGGTAYLEWSEFSGSSGRERIHVQNVVPLGDFALRLRQCRAALDPHANP